MSSMKAFPKDFFWGTATAAYQIEGAVLNAGYLTVMLEGRYTDAFLAAAGADAPAFTPEDLEVISSSVDFVGINVYYAKYVVRAIDKTPGHALVPYQTTHPVARFPGSGLGLQIRIMYLRNCLTHLQRATSEGLPVRGYFHWSLLDNFEWFSGFGPRFGLYYVDYATQRRTPKLSASFYREVISRNEVV